MRMLRWIWVIGIVWIAGCASLLGDFTSAVDDGMDAGGDATTGELPGDAATDAGDVKDTGRAGDASNPETGACGAAGEACCGATCGDVTLSCVGGTCRPAASGDTGLPCTTTADCHGGYCLPAGQPIDADAGTTGSVCTTACALDAGADAGAACVAGWKCVPQSGIPTPVCRCTYAPETCDGVDDDCDGVVDDSPAATNDCVAKKGTGFACVGGACACAKLTCGAACVDPKTDVNNCGACGTVCPKGATCANGACTCPVGATDVCSKACTSTQTDAANCGACGNACQGSAACSAGKCVCPNGATYCNGVCYALSTDSNNCGTSCAAIAKCVNGQTCQGGTCACPSTAKDVCAGVCTSLQTDGKNCGACGTVCGGGATCQAGACTCAGGATYCNGACYVIAKDDAHCGTTCANLKACVGGHTCQSGACACTAGLPNECGGTAGVCTALSTDTKNCGACGNACASNASCGAGKCQCPVSGQTYCPGGVCASLATDDKNCGACGLACGSGQHCAAGSCVCDATSCATGCCSGTTCIQPAATTCGRSGAACTNCNDLVANVSAVTCNGSGTCDYGTCAAGYIDADGVRSNGCESRSPAAVGEAASSLLLWLEADTGLSGSTWVDQSGKGDSATCNGVCPTLVANAINGHYAFSFNGSNQAFNLPGNYYSFASGATMIFVYAPSGTGQQYDALISLNNVGTTDSNRYQLGHGGGDTNLLYSVCASGNCPGAGAGVWTSAWHQLVVEHFANATVGIDDNMSAAGVFFFNGASGSVTLPQNQNRTINYLGFDTYNRHFYGSMAEVIVFNSAISSTSKLQIEQYLRNKYGL